MCLIEYPYYEGKGTKKTSPSDTAHPRGLSSVGLGDALLGVLSQHIGGLQFRLQECYPLLDAFLSEVGLVRFVDA